MASQEESKFTDRLIARAAGGGGGGTASSETMAPVRFFSRPDESPIYPTPQPPAAIHVVFDPLNSDDGGAMQTPVIIVPCELLWAIRVLAVALLAVRLVQWVYASVLRTKVSHATSLPSKGPGSTYVPLRTLKT